MNRGTVLKERGLLHDCSAIINEDDVQGIDKILHQIELILEVGSCPHLLAIVIGSCDAVTANAAFDFSKKVTVVMIFWNFNILLSIFNDLLAQVIMQATQKIMGSYKPTSRFFCG